MINEKIIFWGNIMYKDKSSSTTTTTTTTSTTIIT